MNAHRRRSWFVAMVAAAAGVVAGCFTVEDTGRKALVVIPPEQEMAMGAAAFTELKTQQKVSNDTEKAETVKRVGERISKVVGDRLPNAQWEFILFEDDTPNAFALPGGKVGVHTGLFKVAQSEADLAVVMGHEIAHVTAKHGAERVSHSLGLAVLGAGLEAALSKKDPQTRQLAMGAYGLGASLGFVLPYSRLHESEADEIGLMFAARAGYDPRAAVGFWQRMKEASAGQKPPEWLSTHPSDDTRIRKIQEMMPRMVALYEQAPQKQ